MLVTTTPFPFTTILYMPFSTTRISWDTTVKHYVRNGLFDNLPDKIKAQIPKTNRYRWKQETDSKYIGCEVAHFIKEELELIKRTGESRNAKKSHGSPSLPKKTFFSPILK